MLLKGPRLIIPGKLQEEYLSRLHKGHLSASKVQENAKQHMYWTGIDEDIEDYTKRCQECIKRSQVPKEPLQPHDIPEGPWRKLGIDYFTFDGNSYVLICDYFSKFPFLYRAKTSFWSLRDRLIDLFSIEGYPDEIVSDNGPPFQSKEFAKFLSGLGIKHTTSSQGYPRSTSPELLEMERSFNSLLAGARDRQSHPVTRSQMDNLGDQQQRIAVLKQVASQPQNQPRPRLSASSCKYATSPRIPEDIQVTRGLRSRCRQRMPTLLVRAVTQRQTDYRTFKKSLVDA